MNTNKYILGIICSLFMFTSCNDYLDIDEKVDTYLEYEQIFQDRYSAPGFLNHAYTYLSPGFERCDKAFLASACDEAKHSDSGSLIQLFNNNSISTTVNPDNVWDNMYRGIRVCNIFLKEIDEDGLIVKYNSIPETSRGKFKGEAYFLRALFHFELAKRYQNVFYVDKVYDIDKLDEVFDTPQLSFQEMTEKIKEDCDSAFKYLPNKVSGSDLGRPTKAASLALESRLYLYAASPLYNPENKKELWQKAVDASAKLVDYAGSTYGISLMPKGSYGSIFTTPYNQEIIFATEAVTSNSVETNNFPLSFQGKGYTNPTQDLIDSYACTSTSYKDPRPASKYDPEDPYKNMEDRFNATIFYNNASLKGSTIETFVGGKDGLNSSSTATKTGYYLRKFMDTSIDLSKGQTSRHFWIYSRLAEVILNYAEALNEVQDAPNTKQLHDLLNQIRNRAGLRPFTAASYIKDKDEMREYIKLERQRELAFEEHRFWDLRRWKDEADLNKAISGMKIERENSGTDVEGNAVYTYKYEPFIVENRTFDQKFYWYPIPRIEILKYQNKGIQIKQNPGW